MLMTCIGMGAMLSLGVFLQPMAADMAWSRSGISTAATLDFLCMGAAAFLWGMLSDRYGTRIVVLLGSALLGLGLITASRAQSLLEFQLLFGVLVGVAAGSFYAPMMSAATAWLEHRRSLAAALVSAGMGIGSMTVSPLAGWLIGAFDWRTAMLVIGVLAWTLLIPVSLLVRRPPVAPQPGDGSQLAAATARDYPLSSAQAALTPQFAAIALAHFACCAAHSGPIFHMVSYATLCGLPTMLAVSVFGLAGLAGLGGRIGLGIAADRIGAKPVLVAGLLVQALAVGAYLFVESLAEFFALSIVFGLAYGGVMPLYAVLVRDSFGPHIMGTMFGAVAMFASLGMALGPWAGGFVFDASGGYAWLYLGSFGIGLSAVAIALAFRPMHLPPMPRPLDLKPA
ncbi:MAG: MFS transporter [Hyphomicrobiaceae bacterium]